MLYFARLDRDIGSGKVIWHNSHFAHVYSTTRTVVWCSGSTCDNVHSAVTGSVRLEDKCLRLVLGLGLFLADLVLDLELIISAGLGLEHGLEDSGLGLGCSWTCYKSARNAVAQWFTSWLRCTGLPADQGALVYQLIEVHWLPVKYQMTIKLCTVIYVIYNGCTWHIWQPLYSHTLRSLWYGLRLTVTTGYKLSRLRTMFDKHAFSCAGPAACNSLAADIWLSPTATLTAKL